MFPWIIFLCGTATILLLSGLIYHGYRQINCEAPNVGISCSFLAGTGVYFLFTEIFLPDAFGVWPAACVLVFLAVICPLTAPKESIHNGESSTEIAIGNEETQDDLYL